MTGFQILALAAAAIAANLILNAIIRRIDNAKPPARSVECIDEGEALTAEEVAEVLVRCGVPRQRPLPPRIGSIHPSIREVFQRFESVSVADWAVQFLGDSIECDDAPPPGFVLIGELEDTDLVYARCAVDDPKIYILHSIDQLTPEVCYSSLQAYLAYVRDSYLRPA